MPLVQDPDSVTEPARNGTSTAPPSAPAPAPSRVHLPALDGVRAIAILMVVVYHSLNGLPGMTFAQNVVMRLTSQGWLGVDLFFILSGFLITGILMDACKSAHSLRNFYARRVLRIVPVYILFVMFSLWLAGPLGTSSADEVLQLHRTQAWYWTYSVNILIALRNWSAITFPTGHLWSLAVEEQFYLLWPLAVLLLSPVMLRRTALACILGAGILRGDGRRDDRRNAAGGVAELAPGRASVSRAQALRPFLVTGARPNGAWKRSPDSCMTGTECGVPGLLPAAWSSRPHILGVI